MSKLPVLHYVSGTEVREDPEGGKVIALEGWYFWDKDNKDRFGPFPTHEKAVAGFLSYYSELFKKLFNYG
jgi:hypothetical protein